MNDKKTISKEACHLLIWLMSENLTFTKLAQRFASHKINHLKRGELVDQLVDRGLAEVKSDRYDLARFSKRGRPQRTINITEYGKELIMEIFKKEREKDNET